MTPAHVIGLAVRLRLALLRGGLRSGPGAGIRRAGLVLGAVAGTLLAVLVLLGMSSLRGRPEGDDLAVLTFTLVAVSWVVLPVLTFSSDDLLDPSKLALLPLSRRDVLLLHGGGALVGVAPVATVVACAGLVGSSGTTPASALVAVLAVPLQLALCVVASRTVAASLASVLRSRRGRDVGVALTALVAVSGQLLNPLLQSSVHSKADATRTLHRAADLLHWSPPGLLGSAPGTARQDGLLPGLLQLLLALGVIAVLTVLWDRALRRTEETVDATTASVRRRSNLTPRLLGRLLPDGRLGAVASKDLRYLQREPRRIVALLTALVLPVVLVVLGPLLSPDGGLSPRMVFSICGIALLGGLGGANRFGADGTSTWLLLASGSGRADARRDLAGGDLAQVLAVLPLLLGVGVGLAALCDGWDRLAAAEGLAVALLLIGTGASGLVSVFGAFPVPDGSRGAFSNGGGGQGVAAGFLTLGALLAVATGCLPLLPLLLSALNGGSGVPLLLVGPVYGLLVGAGARELAVRAWCLRGPEVLLRLSSGR